MKTFRPFALSIVALLVGVSGTLAAQGNAPSGPAAPQITLGTTFTYQGSLRRSSGPVTAVCDMAFRLRSLPAGGPVLGDPITTTVPVTNGLFTVGLNFGTGAFTGEERYLDIRVRCPPETGFTALTPFQRIAPVPYALALPGLYTLPNATSPNVIGGYNGNTISDTVVGAVIAGGGTGFGHHNRVSGDFGAVSGGYENWALNAYVTIGGGATNRASGNKSTVPGGQSAHATHEGEFAYANGAFAEIGDAQTSMYVLKATTNSTAMSALMKNGGETGIAIAPGRTVAFDILIAARKRYNFESGAFAAGYRVQGVISHDGGTFFLGTPTVTVLGESDPAWNVVVIANNAADRLDVQVTGDSTPLSTRWVATVRATEVSY